MPGRDKHLLNVIYDELPEAVIATNTAREIVRVNPAFNRIFQYEEAEVLGTSTRIYYASPQDYEETGYNIFNTAAKRGSRIIYTRYRRKDGTIFPCRMTSVQVLDEAGEIIGFCGIIQDLSEIEQEMIEDPALLERWSAENQFLETLYRRTPAIMHSIDENGCLLRVSDAWLARFGYCEEEVIGRLSADFLDAASRTYAKEVLLPRFWRDGVMKREPYVFLTKSGEAVQIELSAVVDATGGARHALAILEDVTERNRATRDLQVRNQDLRNFAHVAAHDLQSPLRHITMLAQVATEDLEENKPEQSRAHLAAISSSAERLSGMVRALLDFSVLGDLHVSANPIDLDALMQRVIAQHEETITETDARITADPLPRIDGDLDLMERVFSNLISNALKYVAPGVPPRIRIRAKAGDGSTRVTITDNGIGIAKDHRDRVFQPLKRLQSGADYAGTGIGLTICKRIVEAHGGQIWISDADGGGSTFTVSLPVRATG